MEVASNPSVPSFLSLLLAPETTTEEDQSFFDHTTPFHHQFNYFPQPFSPPSDYNSDYLPPPPPPPSVPPFTFLPPPPPSMVISEPEYYQHYDGYLFSPPPLLLPSPPPEFLSPLPDFFSFENSVDLHPSPYAFSPPPQHQQKVSPPLPPRRQQQPQKDDDYTLGSILKGYWTKKRKSAPPSTAVEAVASSSKQRRQKTDYRNKMSEKIYCLGKLLPGGYRHRKNTAGMLEEAENYIKFLEAQVNSLRTMPTESRVTESRLTDSVTQEVGDQLRKLSRQQLLQVVVNSAAAQVVMADKEWCLVSAEQLELMRRIDNRKKVIEHLIQNLPL